MWRRGGLVVSVLDFRSGGRWFERSLCHRVVSLDKKLLFHNKFVSPHPGVLMGTGIHNVDLAMD